jgi:hypothetical protein
MKTMHDDRVHARMAVIRDLFGLTVEEGVPSGEALDAALADDGPQLGAEIHELPARAVGNGSRPPRARPPR